MAKKGVDAYAGSPNARGVILVLFVSSILALCVILLWVIPS